MGVLFCEMEVDCAKKWDELDRTADSLVRGCANCGKSVYFIDNQTDLDSAALKGKCVAFINQSDEDISSDIRRQLFKISMHNKKNRRHLEGRVTLGLPRRPVDKQLKAFIDSFPDSEK